MCTLKINAEDWKVAREKLRRKYNHLTDEDLLYQEGGEEQLVSHLAKRLHRSTEYVCFTLSKELADLSSNRV